MIRPRILAIALLLITACTGSPQYAARRREGLLSVYPPGTLTRADVRSRFHGKAPTDSTTRPAEGWITSSPIGERSLDSERRTGKRVESVDRYLRSDGMFSRCYLSFYYDDRGWLVDTDWQRSKD